MDGGHAPIQRLDTFDRECDIQVVKKTKKNEPKFFRALCQIDRDAFDKHGDSGMIIKTFWKSNVNRIIVATKKDT